MQKYSGNGRSNARNVELSKVLLRYGNTKSILSFLVQKLSLLPQLKGKRGACSHLSPSPVCLFITDVSVQIRLFSAQMNC